MEGIAELRAYVKQQIDKADEKTLRMMQAMLEVADEDWWNELPVGIQAEIDKAAGQLDKGEGISYEKVKEKYPQWFGK